MRKLDLVKQLNAMPGNPEIYIMDLARNHAATLAAAGEATREGIYSQYDVIRVPRRYLPKGINPFVVLSFNTDPNLQVDPDVYLSDSKAEKTSDQ